jgi:MSHA biogenesis protein MshJ
VAAVRAALASSAPAVAPRKTLAGAVTPKPGSLLYRHGVEISVRGNYLDMIDYMTALESLPTQLFWGGARLDVEDYPTSRLTLTLYTLSLDSKWLKL